MIPDPSAMNVHSSCPNTSCLMMPQGHVYISNKLINVNKIVQTIFNKGYLLKKNLKENNRFGEYPVTGNTRKRCHSNNVL